MYSHVHLFTWLLGIKFRSSCLVSEPKPRLTALLILTSQCMSNSLPIALITWSVHTKCDSPAQFTKSKICTRGYGIFCLNNYSVRARVLLWKKPRSPVPSADTLQLPWDLEITAVGFRPAETIVYWKEHAALYSRQV